MNTFFSSTLGIIHTLLAVLAMVSGACTKGGAKGTFVDRDPPNGIF